MLFNSYTKFAGLFAIPALMQPASASQGLHHVICMVEESFSIYYSYFDIIEELSQNTISVEDATARISELADMLKRLEMNIEESEQHLNEQDNDAYMHYCQSEKQLARIKAIEERIASISAEVTRRKHYGSEKFCYAYERFVKISIHG